MAGKRMVFLYVGKNRYWEAYRDGGTNKNLPLWKLNSYAVCEVSDIAKYKGCHEFVIVPGVYTKYLEDETVAVEGKDYNSLNDVLNMMAQLTARIIKADSSNRVWLGTPAVPVQTVSIEGSTRFDTYATKIRYCLDTLKEKVNGYVGSTSAFDTYVNGIYMHSEHVLGKNDTAGVRMDYTSLSTMIKHPQVKMFYTISNYVKNTLKKKMLWCPYYGSYGYNDEETIVNVGMIANKTNIFDYVIIQPGYYNVDGETYVSNLEAIRASMKQNRVTYRDSGNGSFYPVSGGKTSSTIIGCQMEIGYNYFDDENRQKKYQKYVDCFNNVTNPLSGYSKANANFSFYCDAKYDLDTYKKINPDSVEKLSTDRFYALQNIVSDFYNA